MDVVNEHKHLFSDSFACELSVIYCRILGRHAKLLFFGQIIDDCTEADAKHNGKISESLSHYSLAGFLWRCIVYAIQGDPEKSASPQVYRLVTINAIMLDEPDEKSVKK